MTNRHSHVRKGKVDMFPWTWMLQKWRPTQFILNLRSSTLKKEASLQKKVNASIARKPGTWCAIVPHASSRTSKDGSSRSTKWYAIWKKRMTKKNKKKERIESPTSNK